MMAAKKANMADLVRALLLHGASTDEVMDVINAASASGQPEAAAVKREEPKQKKKRERVTPGENYATHETVLRTIGLTQGILFGELRNRTGLSSRATHRHLRTAMQAGNITRTGERKSFVYSLTKAGRLIVDRKASLLQPAKKKGNKPGSVMGIHFSEPGSNDERISKAVAAHGGPITTDGIVAAIPELQAMKRGTAEMAIATACKRRYITRLERGVYGPGKGKPLSVAKKAGPAKARSPDRPESEKPDESASLLN
jgi:DNA-binding MarR family transcriptional regulator